MRKAVFLSALAAATLFAGSPAATGALLLSLVQPGDTYSFDISGFNTSSNSGYLLTPEETATFGMSQTYTGAGVNGQDISITSSEAIGATTTTDTFVVSTPTSFITTATIGTTTINELQFDLGSANSGSNTIALVAPIITYTATGSCFYSTSSTATLTPIVTLGTGNLSYSATENVSSGAAAIDTFDVRQFTFAITYSDVPEPSTLALGGLGLIGGAAGVFAVGGRPLDAPGR